MQHHFSFQTTSPLVIAYGLGQDSTGLLIGLKQQGIRPDAILHADTGSERPATYAYRAVIEEWLQAVGFPALTVVRYEPKDFKNWPPYGSLFENCLTNSTLPSLAYGRHSCSSKWKIDPQNKWLSTWQPALDCWAAGGKVTKMIGFDASPHELRRASGCSTYAIQDDEAERYEFRFPLQEWGWDRARCVAEIEGEGLPVPPKSSCYFCPAMKPAEVRTLDADSLRGIVLLEHRAAPRHLAHAESKGWPRGMGKPLTEGLWRRAVLGQRGAIPRPGSMTEFIANEGLLSREEISRVQSILPARPIYKHEIGSWTTFLSRLKEAA